MGGQPGPQAVVWRRRLARLMASTVLAPVFGIGPALAQAPGASVPSALAITDVSMGTWAVLAAFGIAVAAAGVLLQRVRLADAARRSAEERAEEAGDMAARMRAQAHDMRALLTRSAPCVLLWMKSQQDVLAFGDQAEARAAWLGAEAAAQVDAALGRLRDDGRDIDMQVRGADGRLFQLAGRALNGSGVLLIYPAATQAALPEREAGPLLAGLRTVLDAAPTPAWLRDEAGALSYANRAFLEAVGVATLEEAREQGLDLLDSKTRAAATSAESGSGAFRGRVRAVARGQRHQLDVVEMAGPFGLAGLAVDVTEEAAARAEMARVVAAHRNTLDHLTTAVAIFGADERLVFHNAAYERLFDFSPAFLDQKPSDNEILDHLRTRRKIPEQTNFRAWRAELREAYRAVEPVNDWWHLPDGTILRVVLTPNAEGGVTYLFDDLSEHVSLESRYNSLIRMQGETLDGLAEAVAVFGGDGRLGLYNHAFLTLWNLDAATLGDKPHIDTVAALCRPLHGESSAFSRIRAVVTAMEHRETQTLRIERPDGRVLDGAAQPLPDGGTMVTFRDVTDSVKVERALIERAEALEAADRLKNAFVGHVSYHLRTPLNTLVGYADMLREGMAGPLSERQRDYLDHMHHSSDLLRALIDDILDLATIDAGSMELDMVEVDVREMLEGVADAIQDQIKAAQVRLTLNVPAQAGSFTADPRRMRQVLFNLLSNAITASPQGGTVTLSAMRDADSLVLSVRDEGPGIAPELAETLFQRFESRSANLDKRGVGLGLSIVRSFVTLHGGTVRLVPAGSGNVRETGTTATGTLAICVFPLKGKPDKREVAA
ncbi:PAS-domain containing protein [Xanthobacter sp. TB0136]|uniref:PAS-domain containing protein n=1 Tax=Xanthobacter sp. TB0136 TaxID=3459177 RepID=UPI0040395BA2